MSVSCGPCQTTSTGAYEGAGCRCPISDGCCWSSPRRPGQKVRRRARCRASDLSAARRRLHGIAVRPSLAQSKWQRGGVRLPGPVTLLDASTRWWILARKPIRVDVQFAGQTEHVRGRAILLAMILLADVVLPLSYATIKTAACNLLKSDPLQSPGCRSSHYADVPQTPPRSYPDALQLS